MREIDEELTAAYQEVLDADFEVRYETLAPRFKERLLQSLTNPVTFSGPWDKLSGHVLIRPSADGRIKFYSWDDLTGGTWHNITAVAQFKTDKGTIGVRPLSSGNEIETGACTDSEIYDVYDVVMGGAVHYLTFGRGTHGSGLQHEIIQFFRIDGVELIKCPNCLDGAEEVVIEYPRVEAADLEFDPETSKIRYNEFKWDDEAGQYLLTGKVVTLKLVGRSFVRE